MSSATEKPSLSLKLLIDRKKNRVIYAEAGKDFVDFLFSLMSLPIATVIRLLSANEMVGSLGQVYQTVENLSDTYVRPNANKNALLKPNVASLDGVCVPKLFQLPDSSTASAHNKTMYGCSNCKGLYVTYNYGATCIGCNRQMYGTMTVVEPLAPAPAPAVSVSRGGWEGYVKDAVAYMVMDNLEVKPLSTTLSIHMMKKFGMKIGDIQETVVSMGMDKGLQLLKASFESMRQFSPMSFCRQCNIDFITM